MDLGKPFNDLAGDDVVRYLHRAGKLSGELASVVSKSPINLEITHQVPIRIKQQLGRKTSLGVKPTIRPCR